MRTFKIRLSHDNGTTLFTIKNWTEQAAKEAICKAENSPLSAVKSCKETLPKIKTLDITAKEWDRSPRSGGGSYFGAQVIVNYGLPSEQSLGVRFQDGYSDHYQTEAKAELVRAGFLKDLGKDALWAYCREHKIILRTQKIEKCTERECIEWGKVER